MPAQPAHCSQLTVHAVLPASHVWPSFSHSYLPLPAGEEEEDKQGGRRKQGRRQGGTQGRGQEAGPPGKAEGKKAPEAKKVEATVVPPPLDGDGNIIDTEACTVTFIEEPPAVPRKRNKRN